MNFSKKISIALVLVASVAPAMVAQAKEKTKAQKAALVGTAVFGGVSGVAAVVALYFVFLSVDNARNHYNGSVANAEIMTPLFGVAAVALSGLCFGFSKLAQSCHKKACPPEKETTQKKKN